MIGLWILGVMVMVMIVVMMVVMVMTMAMIMVMMVVVIVISLKPAHTRAEGVTQGAVCNIGPRCAGTLPLDVVVVAFLNGANFTLKSQDLGAVFTQNTCGRRHVGECWVIFAQLAQFGQPFGRRNLTCLARIQRQYLSAIATGATVWDWNRAVLFQHALGKGFHHFGMITKVRRFDEFNIRILGGYLVSEPVNPVDQNSREQEIGEHHNAFVRQLGNMLQTRFNKRECHA